MSLEQSFSLDENNNIVEVVDSSGSVLVPELLPSMDPVFDDVSGNDFSFDAELLSSSISYALSDYSVTSQLGNLNSTVRDYMERILDSYSQRAAYVAFKGSSDDSYDSYLFVCPSGSLSFNGSRFEFSDSTDVYHFYRRNFGQGVTLNQQLVYDFSQYSSPVVNQQNYTISYSNAAIGFPVLSDRGFDAYQSAALSKVQQFAIPLSLIFIVLLCVLFRRRH